MSYKIKGKNGLPIKKDGNYLLGYDIPNTKIEQMNELEMSFLAVGSTEDEDRDKDIVRVSGWQLDNFKNNPVLPWSHNYYEPPVGKAVSIKKDTNKKKLIFKAQFDKDDDKARLVFNKYKNGFLNTFSVGFIGLKSALRVEGDYWSGREFTKQELLEISPVTVPSNPNANMDIRSFSDDLPPNLAQMGFKQFTCKTDSGLFIPVTDTEIYTAPFVVSQENGIKAMYASVIDEAETMEKQLVGYVFTTDVDENEAMMWVSEHAPKKSKIKYFDMGSKTIGDTEFDLEIVEEDIEEETLEVEDKGKKPTEEVIEEDSLEETVEEDGCKPKPKPKMEDSETETKEADTEEKVEVEEKDVELEVGDIALVTDDSVEETTEEIPEVKEFKLSEDQLNRIIEEVKKAIVNDPEMDNNETIDSAVELVEETEASKSGDVVEFDDSLFSPVSEEKDSESIIEIDDNVFDEVKSQIKSRKASTSVDLREVLEKSFKKVLGDFSGKLED